MSPGRQATKQFLRLWVGLCLGVLAAAGTPQAFGQETSSRLADVPQPGWSDEQLKAWLAPPPADQPQPKIVCAQTVADAGDAWQCTPGTARWKITNGGSAPLHVELLVTCNATLDGPWRRTLEPGAGTTIEARIDAFGRGKYEKSALTVRSNDRAQPRIDLRATINVLAAMLLTVDGAELPYMYNVKFGDFRRDAGPQKKTVVLKRGDGGPLHPRVATVEVRRLPGDPSAFVPAKPRVQVRELEPGEKYALDVTLEPPWPNRWYSGAVELETGVPQQSTIEVYISASFPERLRWRPTALVPLQRTQKFDWKATLVWSDETPPGKIISIATPVDGMTARIDEKDGELYLVVTIAPECPPPEKGPYFVILKTDDPAVPELRVGVPWEQPASKP